MECYVQNLLLLRYIFHQIHSFQYIYLVMSRNNLKQAQDLKRETSDINLASPPNKKQPSEEDLLKSTQKRLQERQQYLGVNQILVYKFQREPPTYYVPCYLRMRVNRVSDINYIDGKAEIQTEIRVWVMLKQFPKPVQEEIINLAKLEVNAATRYALKDIPEPEKLDDTYMKNTSKKSIGFLLDEEMELAIESDAFWSPFELIKLIANLEIKRIHLGDKNENFWKQLSAEDQQNYKDAWVEFNFLDAHPFLQFSFGEVRNLGSFDIAENMVDMKFSNTTIADDEPQQFKEQKDEDSQQIGLNLINQAIQVKGKLKKQRLLQGQITPDAYEHGQILIPLYKYPSTTIINVFVPFYMVAILNLGVFFELNDMSNRDASLATFQLAYIAFFPTIRDNLPQTPKLVFSEILVYLQSICTLICFFYSLAVNQQADYVFVWNEEPVFLVCMSLTILNIFVISFMFFLHKAVWERKYNTLPKGSTQYMNSKYLNTDDTTQWWNQQCENEFADAIDVGLVKPMFPFKKKKTIQKGKSFALAFIENLSKIADDPSKIHPLED